MFIFDVVPLTFIPLSQPQLLSYFSPKEAQKGGVVEISLGKRKSLAVIIHCEPVSKRKAAIKQADFSLKPVAKILTPTPIFAPISFQLANFLSHYYFIPLSFSLKTVLPKNLLTLINFLNPPLADNLELIKSNQSTLENSKLPPRGLNFPTLINLIKKSNKTNAQILILTPTIFHQEYYYHKLKTEVSEMNLVNFSPSWPKKQYCQLYQNLISPKENYLVLGPKSAIFLPWTNLDLIVIMDSNNPVYATTQKLPHYNTLTVSKILANYFHAQLAYFQNY